MKTSKALHLIRNKSGFIVADFLFAFVMVIGIGIFMFGITFSLATIEVAQYIVWSTARHYAAANVTEGAAQVIARAKFQNLTAKFPLLTGNGADGNAWFELTDANLKIGDLSVLDTDFTSQTTSDDRKNQDRQPWIGVSAKIKLKLFSSLNIPFLGKVAEDPSIFEFPVRAFVLRHPSKGECQAFFYEVNKRYKEGIKKLENSTLANQDPVKSSDALPTGLDPSNGFGEDNGC